MIDPQQHGPSWRGIGLANVLRAGYGHFTRLIEEPSYRALPELERSGQHIDFAFIDGWHTFDFGLVDFFYIDRMLNVGGVVAFDDANWPAIRKLCRFVNTNLSYSLLANLALNFTVLDLYDTEPAAGVPRNELQFRSSLGVKF